MINETDIEAFYESTFGYWTPDEVTYTNYHPSVQEMVTEYHNEADLPFTTWDEASFEVCNLRWNLIEEEFRELMEEADSTEYILKEMADLVYVIYGAAVTFGWDLDEAVRRVHANNMGRMYQPDGTIKRREDGKIEKNKDYPKVELDDLV